MNRRSSPALALCALVVCAAAAMCGCGTAHPPPLDARALSRAQTFPYFRIYWAGPRFDGRPLVAVDGRQAYSGGIGDSVYYGDCVPGKGSLGGGGGSCGLPLQVTTVIYRLHSNAALGAQRNALLRGVPATIYDEGRSIELYSGRVAIDVSSDSPTSALLAVTRLQALNAPAGSPGPLPPPVYCPGLNGPVPRALGMELGRLPGHPCQRARAALAAVGRAWTDPVPAY